jgi:hypothetical protein
LTLAADLPPEVAAYLATVRASLADLPADERDDLLAEVEASLLDTADETGGPIAARLGPPEEFAAELRAAAGLQAAEPPAAGPSLRQSLARVLASLPLERLREPARQLAPLWWVARAYLAVAALALWTDTQWSSLYPAVPRFGDGEGGLVVLGLAAVLSVALGFAERRLGPPWRRLALAANLALLVAVPAVVEHLRFYPQQVTLVSAPAAAAAPGLTLDGQPVQNVYPYSRDGRLLHDVLLYDGAGRPLGIPVTDDPLRRVPVTEAGAQVANAFPIRYYEPGTTIVARPGAAPPVVVPRLATPPLVQPPG